MTRNTLKFDETIVKCVATLSSTNSFSLRWRNAGALEILLCNVGFLDPTKTLEYKKIKRKLFGISFGQRNETYPEMILRLAEDYLSSRSEDKSYGDVALDMAKELFGSN